MRKALFIMTDTVNVVGAGGEALTRLTGLLMLLFINSTRPLTRSLWRQRHRFTSSALIRLHLRTDIKEQLLFHLTFQNK